MRREAFPTGPKNCRASEPDLSGAPESSRDLQETNIDQGL